jgi:hypothetical protein
MRIKVVGIKLEELSKVMREGRCAVGRLYPDPCRDRGYAATNFRFLRISEAVERVRKTEDNIIELYFTNHFLSWEWMLWMMHKSKTYPEGLRLFAIVSICLDKERERGFLINGFIKQEDNIEKIDELVFVSPVFLRLKDYSGLSLVGGRDIQRMRRVIQRLGGDKKAIAFWRTRFVIIGVGRTGSTIAEALIRLGIKRLTLIDPDIIETHNLDFTKGVIEADIGTYKVEAVSNYLRQIRSEVEVQSMACDVMEAKVLEILKTSDFFITAVDREEPRQYISYLSTLLGIPYLDIGSGIYIEEGIIRGGSDVRLILPGDSCIMCMGGLRRRRRQRGDIREGLSPASLNELAIGLSLYLLEEYFAGENQGSIWLRAEFRSKEPPRISVMSIRGSSSCSLCASVGGYNKIVCKSK